MNKYIYIYIERYTAIAASCYLVSPSSHIGPSGLPCPAPWCYLALAGAAAAGADA